VTLTTITGRRRRDPDADPPPTPEQVLLLAERTARWGKAVLATATMFGGFLYYLATTGATVLNVPHEQVVLRARQDSIVVALAALRADFSAHVSRKTQEDRAQTCALKQMARNLDPSGCFEFLPDPTYYDPPSR
jgi:hypothetical protein